MDDNTRAALDAEAPVNPYSLLDAVNSASARSNTLWLLFLGLTAYLALTVGGLTHRDLLLDSGIVLPLLQTRIDLTAFFVVVPAIFALAHLALIAQFVLLARKALEFDAAVRLLESTDLRSHPLRLELDSFFFVQAIAGPERSRVVSAVLHILGWLTLLVVPLALLLFMQAAFLPFHDGGVTGLQRAIVLVDVVLLLLAGVFLMRAETSFFGALLRLGFSNPGSVAFAVVALAGAAFISLSLSAASSSGADRALGIFPRHLSVTDANLAGKDGPLQARPFSLRGRDLRFAKLDRSDLRQVDLAGANLDGASLTGADLRGAQFGCANGAAQQLADGDATVVCTTVRGANFTAARLGGAVLAGADLRGAKLDDAALDWADLSRAQLAGATLNRARLQRANLAGAVLQGASLQLASLQGATLADARLDLADLSGAGLQGASLTAAHLPGTVLREADLEGAELRQAKLYGADLRGARLPAADLAGAIVWRTLPPGTDAVWLADLVNVSLRMPGRDYLDALKPAAGASDERIAAIADLAKELGSDGGWAGSTDGQGWTGLLRTSEAGMADGYKARLSDHLARLACRPRFADGAVADGVLRRALGTTFKGDPGPIYGYLKATECPAVRSVSPMALLELAAAAQAAQPVKQRAADAPAAGPAAPPTAEAPGGQ